MLRRYTVQLIALFIFILSMSAHGQSITASGAGCDYTSAHLYNGWGWNPVSRLSCAPLPASSTSNCDYTDAALYGGWGWNSVTRQSCPPLAVVLPVNTSTRGACVDSDGDGWGWDGVDTCTFDPIDAEDTSNVITNIYAYCEDSDHDGWGWNGADSCRKTFKLRNSDMLLPQSESVRWKAEDLEGRIIQCDEFSYQGDGAYGNIGVTTYSFMTGGNVYVSGGVFSANTPARWYITPSGKIGNWANFNRPAYQTSTGYTFANGFLINNYGPNEVSHYDICYPVQNGSGSVAPWRATG